MKAYMEMAYKAVGKETLQRTYETQLERTARELEDLEAKLSKKEDISIPYRTALTKAAGVLRNPVSIWDSVDAVEKHRLFPFIFEAKLSYTKGAGYRTAENLSTIRLFEELAEANPLDVEVGRIELPSESVIESESTTRSPDYVFRTGARNQDETAPFVALWFDSRSSGRVSSSQKIPPALAL